MTDLSTIQSWPRKQLESAFTQREKQLAKLLEIAKCLTPIDDWSLPLKKLLEAARENYNEVCAERDQLNSELATFHAAMQRECKPDWENRLKDLARYLEAVGPKSVVYDGEIQIFQEAAHQLRSMATGVPTDLEIKALKEQLTERDQALKVAKELLCSAEDKLQFGVGSRDFDPENHTEAAKWQSQRDQSVATINNLLK